MNDSIVTLRGWVGSEVTHRQPRGISVANFRLGCTPRMKRNGDWVDAETTWYSVSAWRTLADNVGSSVRKGDAVVVHGRLRTESWKRDDGDWSTTLVVDATSVGHDLSRGTSTFLKAAKPERPDTDVHEEVNEMIHAQVGQEGQLTSWGDPVPSPRQAEADPSSLPDDQSEQSEPGPFGREHPAA